MMFNAIDKNADGDIRFDEFVAWAMHGAGDREGLAEEEQELMDEGAAELLGGEELAAQRELDQEACCELPAQQEVMEEGDACEELELVDPGAGGEELAEQELVDQGAAEPFGDGDSDWEEEEEEGGEEWSDDFDGSFDFEEENFGEEEDGGGEEAEGGGGFCDGAFPASSESIGTASGDTATGEEKCGAEVTEWIRAPEAAGEGAVLFKDIAPNDVQQGCLGNCWFLAACASVASYPAWIRKTFQDQTDVSPEGRYIIRLFHPRKQRFVNICIDDQLPAAYGQLVFSSITNQQEIWPVLLEKAFAKMSGSYSAIEAGFPAFGMLYLCSGQAEMWSRDGVSKDSSWNRYLCKWGENDENGKCINRKNEEWEVPDGEGHSPGKMWRALQLYTQKNYPLCCSIGNELDDMKGLISGHAYSLITVRKVKSNGKELKLLKIRNPHGETEWTGRWSDSAQSWDSHPDVKERLDYRNENDGSFWMAFHDFVTFFDTFSVVKHSMPLEGCHRDKLAAAQ